MLAFFCLIRLRLPEQASSDKVRKGLLGAGYRPPARLSRSGGDKSVGRATRKYIAYAVGEFILIVEGILVAMQINTWNTNRAQQK